MQSAALAESLRRATHPLALPPAGLPWNLQELDGLLAPGEPRQAAVLVGVVAHAGAPTVLLTRRHDGLRHHAGQVSFPGGRIEAFDASPAAAALREASEEVGLQARQATAPGYFEPLLTITEVAEAFEVPLDLLLDPAMLEEIELHFGGRPRHVLQYRYERQRIWGVTASILFNLRERLASATPGRD